MLHFKSFRYNNVFCLIFIRIVYCLISFLLILENYLVSKPPYIAVLIKRNSVRTMHIIMLIVILFRLLFKLYFRPKHPKGPLQ